jgi:hypothetical protein
MKSMVRLSLPQALAATFFEPIVKWFTLARTKLSQCIVHRMAQANFNIRGWQGRWRYTAPTALFFFTAGFIQNSLRIGR